MHRVLLRPRVPTNGGSAVRGLPVPLPTPMTWQGSRGMSCLSRSTARISSRTVLPRALPVPIGLRIHNSIGAERMRMQQQLTRQLSEYAALKKQRRAKRSADHVILGLVMANVVVFFGWQKVKRFPAKQNVMIDHFTTSYSHLERGKYYTLLTSVFSHGDLGHLFANMVGLYFFGTPICALVGRNRFLALYLGSGVVSSWAAVYEQKRSDRLAFNFGASGAVNSVTAMSILRNPRSTLLLFGLIPLPAWFTGSLFIGRDLYGWVTDRQDGVGYFAHLSGAFTGSAYFAYLRYVNKTML